MKVIWEQIGRKEKRDCKRKEKPYFYGWYFRCQGKNGTVAVIPAVHLSSEKCCCSIQVLTKGGSLYQEFPLSEFRINRKEGVLCIGENIFSDKELRLRFEGKKMNLGKDCDKVREQIQADCRIAVSGRLRLGERAELKYDIMGPFAFVPGMECRHAVYSMKHTVDGSLSLGKEKILFRNGKGYMEGDSGSSFPDQYIWTQHFFREGSIVIAAASVPLGRFKFTGILGCILYKNREYRFATYLGAAVIRMGEKELLIRQGHYRLHVRFYGSGGEELRAPQQGRMSRNIREAIVCRVEYTLTCSKRILFHIVTDQAAAECEVRAK